MRRSWGKIKSTQFPFRQWGEGGGKGGGGEVHLSAVFSRATVSPVARTPMLCTCLTTHAGGGGGCTIHVVILFIFSDRCPFRRVFIQSKKVVKWWWAAIQIAELLMPAQQSRGPVLYSVQKRRIFLSKFTRWTKKKGGGGGWKCS